MLLKSFHLLSHVSGRFWTFPEGNLRNTVGEETITIENLPHAKILTIPLGSGATWYLFFVTHYGTRYLAKIVPLSVTVT